MRLPRPLSSTWSSTQARSDVGAFESVQRVELPAPVVERSAAGARRLGEVYWRQLERSTLGLVRARSAGRAPELRLLGIGPALLRFGEPEIAVGAASVASRYPIRGGLLARVPGGSISFAQTGSDHVEVRSAISGFFPRLATSGRWNGFLYAHVQARLHVALSRSYFARLWHESAR